MARGSKRASRSRSPRSPRRARRVETADGGEEKIEGVEKVILPLLRLLSDMDVYELAKNREICRTFFHLCSKGDCVVRDMSQTTVDAILSRCRMIGRAIRAGQGAITRKSDRTWLYLHNGGLRSLELETEGGTVSGIETLSIWLASGALERHNYLDLSREPVGDDGMRAFARAWVVAPETQLAHLHLNHTKIGDAGVAALATACVGAMRQLSYLMLNDNMIGDVGVRALVHRCSEGALPMLEKLYLARNRIGDDGMAAFANKGMRTLNELDLENNRIGDDGVAAFAAGCGPSVLPSLERLQLWLNHIGSVGVRALIVACTDVNTLPQCTEISLDTLSGAIPDELMELNELLLER